MGDFSYNGKTYLETEKVMQKALLAVGITTFRYYPEEDLLVLSDYSAESLDCPKAYEKVKELGVSPLFTGAHEEIFLRMLDYMLRGNESASEKLCCGKNKQHYNVSMSAVRLEDQQKISFIVGIIENLQLTMNATEMVRALSDNYETIIYADLDTEEIIPYRVKDNVITLLAEKFENRSTYSEILEFYIRDQVVKSEQDDMIEDCSAENVKKALAVNKLFVYDYTTQDFDGTGQSYWRMKAVRISEPSKNRVVIGFADVSQEKVRELERYAYIDPVTNGDNYIRFKEKLTASDRKGYLVSMDIHSFKIINSVCGIAKGDETIREIYKTLLKVAKGDDLAAHINADHFVVFFATNDKAEVETRIQRICGLLEILSDVLSVPKILAYFGAAEWDNSRTVELVYSDANTAKREIKERSDLNLAFYSKMDSERLMAQKAMEDSFESSIRGRMFEVWYQPKYDPETNEMVGAEALIRWRGKDGKLISPGEFIPLFEKNGMIRFLDEYVFRSVCLQQKAWEFEGLKPLPISVNLSRASLYFSNVVEQYRNIIDEIGVDPRLVPIEITESAAVANGNIKQLADDFYKAGFLLHIDDFGTGYSSLATLNLLHFDTLKLDKSLIDYIGNYGGERLLDHTISLAKELGMKVCAEGVEKQEQVEFLKQLNCNSIQGYYYSRPVPLDDFASLRA